MNRVGRIVAVVAPDRATVELEGGVACARCASGRGCGAALFAPSGAPLRLDCRLVAARDVARAADGSADGSVDGTALVGERVEIELTEAGAAWLVPVLLAYGLPTAGLLGGAMVAEPWTPLASLAGLGGGLLAWRLAARRMADGRPGGRFAASFAAAAGPCRAVARTTPIRDHRFSSEGESA